MALWGDGGELGLFNLNPLGYVGGRVTIAVDLFGFEGDTIPVVESDLSLDALAAMHDAGGIPMFDINDDSFASNLAWIETNLREIETIGYTLENMYVGEFLGSTNNRRVRPLISVASYQQQVEGERIAQRNNRIVGAGKLAGAVTTAVLAVAVGGGAGALGYALAVSTGMSGAYQLGSGSDRFDDPAFSEAAGGIASIAGFNEAQVESLEDSVSAGEFTGAIFLSVGSFGYDMIRAGIAMRSAGVTATTAADEAGAAAARVVSDTIVTSSGVVVSESISTE